MALDYSRLNLDIQNNQIQNTDDIIEHLQNEKIDQEGYDFLSTLLNKLQSGEIEDVDKIIEVINSKILQFESELSASISNQEALASMQRANSDLKRLSIKKISHENNESQRDLEYITITREDGTVDMLVCEFGNKLNEYIQKHYDEIASLTADEVFEHFRDYYYRELNFEEVEKFKKETSTTNEAIEKPNESYSNDQMILEINEMKKFKESYALIGEITVAIDPLNNERIYQVDGGVFKFVKEGDILKRQTILEPIYTRKEVKEDEEVREDTELSNSDLLDELYSSESEITPQTTQVEETKYNKKEEIEETKVIEQKEDIDYTQIKDIDTLDPERFSMLLDKKDLYVGELTIEEELELKEGVKFLIENMENTAKGMPSKEVSEQYECLLDRYFNEKRIKASNEGDIRTETEQDSRINTFGLIIEELALEDALSELEKQFIAHFEENQRYLREMGISRRSEYVKQRVLTKADTNKSGITTIVMLLEIAILAMFILMFIRIDI